VVAAKAAAKAYGELYPTAAAMLARFSSLVRRWSRARVILSTYNGEQAPREVDIAAVEADVAGPDAFTYSILRPAWVMQNFTDDHLPLVSGTLTVPSDGGAGAFIDAGDIPAVLGRPATSFRAFAQRSAATWATPAGK
jgi:hypothetical protein